MSIKQKYENLKMFLYYKGMLSAGGIKMYPRGDGHEFYNEKESY